MKRTFFLLTLILFLTNSVFGQAIPKQISYQGVLKDAGGNILTGDFAMTFKIYNDAIGGTELWTETQTVSVANGLFNAQLGEVTSITTVPFDRIHFLGIAVGAESELTPRTLLSPTPYSFMAMNVLDDVIATSKIQDGAITAVKIGSNEVVKSLNGLKDDVNLVAGTNITLTPSGNNITIDAAAGGGGTIGGSGTTDYIPKFSNSTTLQNSILFVNNDKIGIGTTTPGAGLSLSNADAWGSAISLNNTGGGLEWRISSWTDGKLYLVKTTGSTFSPLVIEPVDGKVGIGTSTPDQQLSVHTSSGISYIRVSDNTSGTASGLRLGMSAGNAYIINDASTKSLSLGTSGTSKMRIDDVGHVGINTLTPGLMLHIKQDVVNQGLRIEHQSTVDYWANGIGTTTKNYKFYYNNIFRADISSVDGAYIQSSDLRLKKDIEYMEPVLNKVSQLKAATFQFIDSQDKAPQSTGFIAQEVENIFPDLVRETDDGYKGLVYDGFAVIAIKAIQEQQNIIEELTKRIENLERK